MKTWRYYVLSIVMVFASLVLGACSSPNVATPTINCEASGKCTITVKNEEAHQVKYHIALGYEPQERAIAEEFRQTGENAPKYHEAWKRNNSIFFQKDGTFEAGETITFETTLPKEFKEFPGYSLLTLYVQLDPPHGFSTNYGRYYAYAAYTVPGTIDRMAEYDLECSEGVAEITITNNHEWHTLTFAAYLNEDLDTPWEKFTVSAGDTLTFTTKPFPANARLLEVDVEGHQADTDWDNEADVFYHTSRGLCIPNTPALTLKLPQRLPSLNPDNQ